MRLSTLSSLLLFSALATSACSSSNGGDRPDGGSNPGSDAGTSSTADGGGLPGVDAGPPRCLRDQNCGSGEVCNVATGICGPGHACTTQTDCDQCSAFSGAIDCGHGFHVNAYCDTARGGVCTRALAPCEPCAEDKDCGELHASIRATGEPGKCLEYAPGEKYCGRDSTFGCPLGFLRDPITNQCKREGGCSGQTAFCPAPAPGQGCPGTDQLCADAACPGTGGGICVNNDLPGGIGICIGACREDNDCTDPAFPVCNTRNGICIPGCTPGSCAGGQVCHQERLCAPACTDDAACEMRFGTNYYCNLPGRPAPRQYKDYHDDNSCAPMGCEKEIDCPSLGQICDKTMSPPACRTGCYTNANCLAGEYCKTPGPNGPQPSYTIPECRALAEKTDDSLVGACCNPGCTDRVNDCGFNEWCCGEPDSPYQNEATCGEVIAAGGNHQATGGECFPVAPRPVSPFCAICGGQNDPPCNSDNYNNAGANWTFGYNQDPAINNNTPFREQEFCMMISMDVGMCTVTCNPNAPDKGCPRLWTCQAMFALCMADGDCGGLTCDGADAANMIPGRCLCGTNGTPSATCPGDYPASLGMVDHPRCIPFGGAGKMFCAAGYGCQPPQLREIMPGVFNYPDACLP